MTKEEKIISLILQELLNLEVKYPFLRDEFQPIYHFMEFGPPGSQDDLS